MVPFPVPTRGRRIRFVGVKGDLRRVGARGQGFKPAGLSERAAELPNGPRPPRNNPTLTSRAAGGTRHVNLRALPETPRSSFVKPGPGAGQHDPVDFAPSDLTDGRPENDWRSRYTDRGCIIQIWCEATYLAALLAGGAFLILLVWVGTPRDWLGVSPGRYTTFSVYAYAWLSGVLGGTLFAIKWLYHTVAHGYWNADRLVWRLFTPHLSGAFAFGLIALITSSIFEVLNRDTLRAGPAVVGLGLLLGYFSDFTVARLAEFARDILGERRARDDEPTTR